MFNSTHVLGNIFSLSLFLLNRFPWLELNPHLPRHMHVIIVAVIAWGGFIYNFLSYLACIGRFFLKINQTQTLISHYRYAAVLVVFLGNFNPGTLTG